MIFFHRSSGRIFLERQPVSNPLAALREITDLLAGKIGLDYSTIGIKSIELAVNRKMNTLGIESIHRFATLLGSDEAEFQAFVESIVVPETWFFRDVEPFNFLKEEVIGRFMNPAPRPLRILSIPSSTGEEPYSVAISLLDINFPPEITQIDAVDISEKALKKGKAALFGKSSFRGEDAGMLEKYFTREGESFRLNERARKMVSFQKGNLCESGFLNGKQPYDIVFCRNLVIYLDKQARETAVANIKRLLKKGGYLFSGHTEVMFFAGSGFSAISRPKTFVLLNEEPVPRVSSAVKSAAPGFKNNIPERNFVRPSSAVKQKVAGRISDAGIPPGNGFDIEYIKSLADGGDYPSARKKCEELIFREPTNRELLCLMGVIDHATGLIDEAENNFLKVLYLEPNHEEALVHISLLYDEKGDSSRSKIYRERLKRITDRKNR